jgi:hypothetical protein
LAQDQEPEFRQDVMMATWHYTTFLDERLNFTIRLSANVDCKTNWHSKANKACKDRAAIEARFKAIGWCFGEPKPRDADRWNRC